MKNKKCGGPENKPDEQNSPATTVKTEDGCEQVHINMGTGQVTYTPAKDGACDLEKKEKK